MANLINMRPSGVDTEALGGIASALGGKGLVLLEIGCYRGQGTEIFAKTGAFSRIFCVDPWEAGYDEKDPASSSDMAAVEADFDARTAKYGFVTKVKGGVDDFVRRYPGERVDVVYVDACHTYECTRQILGTCVGRIRPRLYAGHDYVDVWPGVMKAVDEVLGKPDKVYGDKSWSKLANPSA